MNSAARAFQLEGHRIETVVQGDYRISSDTNVVLSTVLGSCVSACLYDPVAGIGGMNHFLLAVGRNLNSRELKYGAMAMELLINELLKSGASRRRMQAKLFGGARMTAEYGNIGEDNAAFGRTFLENEGFEIVAESLGGVQARRLHFHPASGRAKLLVVPSSNADLAPRPTKVAAAPSAPVELF